MALTLALGLNVKHKDFLFDTPLWNTIRTGSALSIIYTISFSFPVCPLMAETSPNTNGGWLGENIYQHYSRVLQNSVNLLLLLVFLVFFNRRAVKLQPSHHCCYSVLHKPSWCCLVESQHPSKSFCCCIVNKSTHILYFRNQFYRYFGVHNGLFVNSTKNTLYI